MPVRDTVASSPVEPRAGDRRSEDVAWPSVVLAVATLAAYAGVCASALAGALPLWAACLLNALLAYVAFTPLHEAAHGNVNGPGRRLRWLNEAIGWLAGAVLLAPYPAFRALHLRHHGTTNDPERDPDYWVATRHPLMLVLRCASIVPRYYHEYLKGLLDRAPALSRTRRSTLLALGLGLTLLGGLALAGFGREALFLWVAPAFIALPVLAFLFDWLPHHPHEERSRYRNTRVMLLPGLTVPTLCQNYHLVHHLHPRVPFYRYPSVFRARRAELEAQNAPITEWRPWGRLAGSDACLEIEETR